MKLKHILLFSTMFILMNCSHHGQYKDSYQNEAVKPGSFVFKKDKKIDLYPGKIEVGDDFFKLVPSEWNLKNDGRVGIINLVPSIDTAVCEAQNHDLGESKFLYPQIRKITISRDLPAAQKRFAEEAKLKNIEFYSDYKFGNFGKRVGLLMKGPELLTRGVMVVDQKGIIQHIQIVKQITKLPNMQKAFEIANSLTVQ